MSVIKAVVQMDLSELALDDARCKLGATDFWKLKLWCSDTYRQVAYQLQGKHGFELVVVPNCVLASDWAWAAQYGNDTFWSTGAI